MRYSEKLKDPRWQRKKCEIMTRDNFTCQECGATDKTLHVHHITYENCSNGEPWTCPNGDLVTLCEDCHKEIHRHKSQNSYYPVQPEFDECDTKSYISNAGLEFYDIAEDYIKRKGLFRWYMKPLTRIIDAYAVAEEWKAIIELTHMMDIPALKKNGWIDVYGDGVIYENKDYDWDEESETIIKEYTERRRQEEEEEEEEEALFRARIKEEYGVELQ